MSSSIRRLDVLSRHVAKALPGSPDPDGLLEYSVVYSDRGINHMSTQFIDVMQHISSTLKKVYNARSAIVIPGSGSYGMEAVARQFATGKKCLVIRNGYFSYRWTDIFEQTGIPSETIVMKARPDGPQSTAQFSPCPIDEVTGAILREKPAVVFAPHVETSAGLVLPDDYIRAVARAVHSVGGLFVLDCIASGCLWADMKDLDIDALISAPQKGWSGPPCAALVMLGPRGHDMAQKTESSSMVINLKKWLDVMETYEKGGHVYYTTMPTNALKEFSDVMRETEEIGFDAVKRAQIELGSRMRAFLESRGIRSVAAQGFKAPSVVVSHTNDPGMKSGSNFKNVGVQIASGVPLKVGEHPDFSSFRLGLFGLDKLLNIDRTMSLFEATMDKM